MIQPTRQRMPCEPVPGEIPSRVLSFGTKAERHGIHFDGPGLKGRGRSPRYLPVQPGDWASSLQAWGRLAGAITAKMDARRYELVSVAAAGTPARGLPARGPCWSPAP